MMERLVVVMGLRHSCSLSIYAIILAQYHYQLLFQSYVMLRMVNLKGHGLLTVLALPEWNERIEEKLRPADWAVMANIVTTLKVSFERL